MPHYRIRWHGQDMDDWKTLRCSFELIMLSYGLIWMGGLKWQGNRMVMIAMMNGWFSFKHEDGLQEPQVGAKLITKCNKSYGYVDALVG